MNQQTSSSLFTFMRKTQEAQAVRLGVNIQRQFSDEDLAPSMALLSEAEREILTMTPAERLGELSAVEQAALNDLNAKTLIRFRVTVTVDGRATEVISLTAPDACAAMMQSVEMLFGDFSVVKPNRFKVKVEPVTQTFLRRAA